MVGRARASPSSYVEGEEGIIDRSLFRPESPIPYTGQETSESRTKRIRTVATCLNPGTKKYSYRYVMTFYRFVQEKGGRKT